MRASLEAAAEGEVQVDALHALLGLDANEGGLRGVQRQLPLGNESQVRRADFELRADDLERSLTVALRLRQNLLAFARGDFSRERVLDLAERAQADGSVGGDRLFLLGRPDLDLCFQLAAPEDWHQETGAEIPDWVVAVLKDE